MLEEIKCCDAFHVYAKRYLEPATDFLVAILYWLTWPIVLGSEFTAAGLIMQNWFPNIPIWSWGLLFMILIFLTNFFSVKIFAETEFFFSLVKVLALILFIILGSAVIIGILPYADFKQAPGLSNLTKNGWFPNGFGDVFTTMLTVNFAFSGTELIGITASEAKDPQKTVPQAIHTTLWRLVIFFIDSIVVMSSLIPYEVAGRLSMS